MHKSKEDLAEIIHELKMQLNHKEKVIQNLKIRNEKIKQRGYGHHLTVREDFVGTFGRPRPKSSHHSHSFLAIPKDKESLEEQIRHLKLELNEEKTDKKLLQTEFNRLREFLGKIKKDRMAEGRKHKNERNKGKFWV